MKTLDLSSLTLSLMAGFALLKISWLWKDAILPSGIARDASQAAGLLHVFNLTGTVVLLTLFFSGSVYLLTTFSVAETQEWFRALAGATCNSRRKARSKRKSTPRMSADASLPLRREPPKKRPKATKEESKKEIAVPRALTVKLAGSKPAPPPPVETSHAEEDPEPLVEYADDSESDALSRIPTLTLRVEEYESSAPTAPDLRATRASCRDSGIRVAAWRPVATKSQSTREVTSLAYAIHGSFARAGHAFETR